MITQLKRADLQGMIDRSVLAAINGVSTTLGESIREAVARALEARAPHQAVPGEMFTQFQHASQHQVSKATEPGMLVGRVTMALAHAKGNVDIALAWAKNGWGADDLVVKALSMGEATAGGFLLGPAFTADFIELLRPMAVVRSMTPTLWPMEYGTAEVPKVTGGASSSFIGENMDTIASNMSFGQVKLVAKSLRSMVPISNKLLRYSSPNADTVVRNDMLRSMSAREDLAFIRDVGTQFTPRGLRSWALPGQIFPSSGTVNLANTTAELGMLELALMTANVPEMNRGWLFAPRAYQYLMSLQNSLGMYAFRPEMQGGTLFGKPYKVTTQIPSNLGTGGNESEVYLVEFADAVIGESYALTIDASNEASYIDPASGILVSAFSQDQTVIRAIHEIDFGMRHDESVAVLTGVKWGV